MFRRTFMGVLVAVFGAAPVVADELAQFPQRSTQRAAGSTGVQSQDIGRWVRQLVDEIEHLEEDLHFERVRVSRELYDQVDQTLQAAVHFERVVQQQGDQEHLTRDFQQMDRIIHELVNTLASMEQSWIRRAASRIQYADQQLHYQLVPRNGGQGSTNFRERVARHAHVLELESRQLAQATKTPYGRAAQQAELAGAIDSFADAAEHFHASVERGADREHLRSDFSELDDQWHRVAHQVNRSQYGIYLRGRAARVNQVHNQLHALVGAADHHAADRREVERRAGERPVKERRAGERPVKERRAVEEAQRGRRQRSRIEFEIPGVGRFQF